MGDRTLLAFIWSYARPYQRRVSIGLAAILLNNLLGAGIPLLIREGVNAFSNGRIDYAIRVGVFMLLIALPRAGLQTAARLGVFTVSRDVECSIRNDLFRRLLSLEPAFYSRMRTGDIMARATNDLNAVRLMLGPGASGLFESLVLFPIAFVLLAGVDFRLTLLALLPAPFAVLLVVCFGRAIRNRFEAIQSLFSTLSAFVQQHVSGVRVVRAFVREENEVRRFDLRNDRYAEANCRLAVMSSALDPLLGFLMGLSIFIVLWIGGRDVLEKKISLGSFAMFTTYMGALLRPVATLGRAVNLIQRGLASSARLRELLAERPSIHGPHPLRKKELARPARGEIRFENVSVCYGENGALKPLTLTVFAGSSLAIVGTTGSGKSTLARLIPRLIDPSAGCVRIDGLDLRDLTPHDLREQIGFVPQENFLFNATLAENIAFGSPSATRPEIEEAANLAGLAEDIAGFPLGLETVVGERGILLSGGQKQRVAIARAVIRKAPILVFDDALSSVDSLTEQRILDHLDRVMIGRTTILISHRMSTVRRADSVVVLSDGDVIEQGSHDELIARRGRYWEFCQDHLLEEELETT